MDKWPGRSILSSCDTSNNRIENSLRSPLFTNSISLLIEQIVTENHNARDYSLI